MCLGRRLEKNIWVLPCFSHGFHWNSCIKDALPSTVEIPLGMDSPFKWLDGCGKSAVQLSKKLVMKIPYLFWSCFFVGWGSSKTSAGISLTTNLRIDVDQLIIPSSIDDHSFKLKLLTSKKRVSNVAFFVFVSIPWRGPEFVRVNTQAGSKKQNLRMLFQSWKYMRYIPPIQIAVITNFEAHNLLEHPSMFGGNLHRGSLMISCFLWLSYTFFSRPFEDAWCVWRWEFFGGQAWLRYVCACWPPKWSSMVKTWSDHFSWWVIQQQLSIKV